jgi:hypothetical protein
MKTDELVRILAADSPRARISVSRRIWIAAAIGLALGAVLFALALGPRPDFVAALQDPRFDLKFAVMLAVAITCAGLLVRLARPGPRRGSWAAALVLVPALIGAGIAYELKVFSASGWWTRLVGRNWLLCLISIPLLAAPALAALLYALRGGAPTSPALTGGVAGMVAGGLGGALYAAHCIDDSPLFVLAWYGSAMVAVAIVGALAGGKVLRW